MPVRQTHRQTNLCIELRYPQLITLCLFSAAEAVSLADWARVEAERSPCREFLWSDISYSEGNWTRETGAGTVRP